MSPASRAGLTPDLAVAFRHEGLLRPEDLERLFPDRRTLAFDRQALLASYAELCRRQCTSPQVIAINLSRAGKLLETLGDLRGLSPAQVESWQNERLAQVSRKTVNLEMDVLRQLLDLCVRHRPLTRMHTCIILSVKGGDRWHKRRNWCSSECPPSCMTT